MALAAVACASCSVSPKPEPPGPELELELGLVTTRQVDGPDPQAISGGPGAAGPPGAVVRAVNLEQQDDPTEGVVQPDGSFAIGMSLEEGDEVRLQLFTEQTRSAPLDVVVGPSLTSPTLAVRPLGDCLLLEPAAEIDSAQSQVVRVVNHCAADVTFALPSLRRPVAGLEIGQGASWPLTLSPESTIDVALRFDAAPGATEEIAFLEATDPELDRRPITVWPLTP